MDNVIAFFISSMVPIILLFLITSEKKNQRLLSFFMWGMVAFVLAIPVNGIFFNLTNLSSDYLSVSTGPIVEEFLKMIPLIYIFLNHNQVANVYRQDIISLSMAAGVGFAIQENIQYILSSNKQGTALVFFVLVRCLSTCLMHGLSTAIIGYGLYLMSKTGKRMLPMIFGFFSLAVIFHALYNLVMSSSYYLAGFILPIIVYLAAVFYILPQTDN